MSDDLKEFRMRFRGEDHDNNVRSAYKVLSMMIDEFEAGTAYGISNDPDGTPYIYASHETMTRESFLVVFDEAVKLAAEDNDIVYFARVVHEIMSQTCDMIDAKATDEEIARYLMAYDGKDEFMRRMEKFAFRRDFERFGPVFGERFQGVMAAARIIAATEKPQLSEPAN